MNKSTNTQKYIINYDKILGEGANAEVYLGVKCDSGLQCALKCSKKLLMDEVTIMKDLTHKNIIEFYDSLQNFDYFTSVICMEYCSQGSLLDFAELHQGLCDNMFLKVLECLHQGLYYLRGKSLVHRDIKPGNMMIHRDNFGDYHVKLGDLGTAKRVPEGSKFTTLCGTLAYLNPDLLIGYLENLDTDFKASTDLWSVGITLYHAAITKLPFIPFQNKAMRINYNIIKHMYLNKPPGVISGRQNSDSIDDITWSDTLPDSCQLSPMLKELASKLIYNLMDQSDANTYDRFFDEANRLSQKKRLLVFNSLTGELQIIYLDTLSYNSVTDQISKSMGYQKEELILLRKNKKLVPPIEPNAQCFPSLPIRGHTRYKLTSNTVLVVVKGPITEEVLLECSHSHIDDSRLPHTEPVYPSLEYDNGNLKNEYNIMEQAKKYREAVITSIYDVNHRANYIDCQIDCYMATANSFNAFVLEANHMLLNEALWWQVLTVSDTCMMTEALLSISRSVINARDWSSGDLGNRINKCEEDIKELRGNTSKDQELAKTMGYRVKQSRTLTEDLDRQLHNDDDSILNDSMDSLLASAEGIVNEMKMLQWRNVVKDENKYRLEIWSRLVNLFDCFKSSKSLFDKKSSQIVDIHRSFFNWMKPSLVLMADIQSLRESLRAHEDDRLAIRVHYLHISDALQPMLQELCHGMVLPSLEFVDVCSFMHRLFEVKEIVKKMVRAEKKLL